MKESFPIPSYSQPKIRSLRQQLLDTELYPDSNSPSRTRGLMRSIIVIMSEEHPKITHTSQKLARLAILKNARSNWSSRNQDVLPHLDKIINIIQRDLQRV